MKEDLDKGGARTEKKWRRVVLQRDYPCAFLSSLKAGLYEIGGRHKNRGESKKINKVHADLVGEKRKETFLAFSF